MSVPDRFPAPRARDLTPEEEQAESRRCYKLHENVRNALSAGREAMWQLAEALHEFDERAGWRWLGYETKSEWLADPEIGIKQNTYNRLLRAWRTLVVSRGVDQSALTSLDRSKVDIVLPAVERGERTVEDALDDVRSLGWRDLRDSYLGEQEQGEDQGTGDGNEATLPAGQPADGPPVKASDAPTISAAADAQDDVGDVVDDGLVSRVRTPPCPGCGAQAVWSVSDLEAVEDDAE